MFNIYMNKEIRANLLFNEPVKKEYYVNKNEGK